MILIPVNSLCIIVYDAYFQMIVKLIDYIKRSYDEKTLIVEIILALTIVGGLGILFFPLKLEVTYLHRISISIVISISSYATGSFLGFLFGIPKTMQSGNETDQEIRYQQNTNLEQISDWLTKILVGLGLTQLNEIGTQFEGLIKFTGAGLDGSRSAEVFTGSIIIYFVILGFLMFYLWSRLNLAIAFKKADNVLEKNTLVEALVSLNMAAKSVSHKNGEKEIQTSIRKLEQQLLKIVSKSVSPKKQLNKLADEYNKIRISNDPSLNRTFLMSKVMAEISALASGTGLTPESFFDKKDGGRRLIALAIIKANPKPKYHNIVIQTVRQSLSAFEQYHALRAAEEMLNTLDNEKLKLMSETITSQMSEDDSKNINPENEDRWIMANNILKKIKTDNN
ncbi:MAG: hypothetical protein R8G66_01290 [Cytophagales bacterium]|nr:hypothetical protein [Cytophagales bacterium]